MERFNEKFRVGLVVAGLAVVAHAVGAWAQMDLNATPVEEQARAFVQMLAEGRFEDTPPLMDTTMNRVLPPATFRTVWNGLKERTGELQAIRGTRRADAQGYRIVLVDGDFEREDVTLRVVYDAEGKVSGFFTASRAPVAKPVPPPYADPSTFEEEAAEVPCGGFTLPGTLTLPKGAGPWPVVVLVHGSGPNDRDETIGPNKVFRDLAWGLAARGVASLRYDKRTYAHPEQVNRDTVTYREETVDDAVTAAGVVAGDARFDPKRIVVLGHSLGGELAPLIAQESDAADGVVIMAGSTRPLVETVLRQYEYIFRQDGALSEAEQAELDMLRQSAQDVLAGKPGQGLFAAVNKTYLDALNAYDGPAVAAALTMPVLVAQGARDYQVLAEQDFADWKRALAGRPNVTFKLYAKLDHLFMPGTGPSYPGDYQKPRNVSREFVDDLAAWVKGIAGADAKE